MAWQKEYRDCRVSASSTLKGRCSVASRSGMARVRRSPRGATDTDDGLLDLAVRLEPLKEHYMKRNLLIPTLLATALATPFAFAQSVGGNAGAAVQAGPVNAGAQVQSQVDAQAHTNAV